MPTPRIVSLIASATEIVCALGMEENLVGRSHECDYPPSVRRLPVCTEPKFDVAGSSADIDRRVKEILRDALSVYRVDAELLKKLRPDIILTQTQCEVCAVSERDVAAALADRLDWEPQIISLAPNALADVWSDIERAAKALGVAERGQTLVAQLKERMQRIQASGACERPGAPTRPTVACIEWIEPLMAAGNWMPELIELAGGIDLFGKPGTHAPPITCEALRTADPDVIVVTPCGFDLERTITEMPTLARQPGWNELRATRRNRAFVADGNQYFNRPGPRVVESLEILAEILHPDRFHFGHEGTGWVRWE